MVSDVRKIYLATGNAHKVREFQQLALSTGTPVEFVRPESMPAVVEDTGTFIGNARKKAMALKAILPPEAWVLADDSGLCVDALGGAPGVESAYYAGPEGDSAANLRKLTEVMRDIPSANRGARFVCVLMLLGPAGIETKTEGECEGVLASAPTEDNGFGYDPLFMPKGYSQSFAQLNESDKNKISHRGRAWLILADWLKTGVGDRSVS